MKSISHKLAILVLTIFALQNGYGQSKVNNTETSAILKGDTLTSAEGVKLFVGQQLSIGEPSGKDGYYRSIISKKAAIVPSIWGQDKRYENAIENIVDSKKNKDKLTLFLKSAKFLTIKKIFFAKSGKPYFYMVLLSSETGECKADIQLALRLRELILKP
jgi:hypothetical protein